MKNGQLRGIHTDVRDVANVLQSVRREVLNSFFKHINKIKMKAHVKFLMMGLVAISGFGAIIMLLWNWLMPSVFGLAAISFWQALGLLALVRILFGNIGGKFGMGMGRPHHRHHNHLREKWEKMTPEERKRYVENRHFGHGFAPFRCGGEDGMNPEEPEKKE
jgi:hypothetical protein